VRDDPLEDGHCSTTYQVSRFGTFKSLQACWGSMLLNIESLPRWQVNSGPEELCRHHLNDRTSSIRTTHHRGHGVFLFYRGKEVRLEKNTLGSRKLTLLTPPTLLRSQAEAAGRNARRRQVNVASLLPPHFGSFFLVQFTKKDTRCMPLRERSQTEGRWRVKTL
jgi:hypothetical protein